MVVFSSELCSNFTAMSSRTHFHHELTRELIARARVFVYIYIMLGLDDQGIEHPSRPALGATHSPLQRVLDLFPDAMRPGHEVHKPPHLVPMLRKEWNYSSTASFGLHGLF